MFFINSIILQKMFFINSKNKKLSGRSPQLTLHLTEWRLSAAAAFTH
jgi:hypothetical protein